MVRRALVNLLRKLEGDGLIEEQVAVIRWLTANDDEVTGRSARTTIKAAAATDDQGCRQRGHETFDLWNGRYHRRMLCWTIGAERLPGERNRSTVNDAARDTEWLPKRRD